VVRSEMTWGKFVSGLGNDLLVECSSGAVLHIHPSIHPYQSMQPRNQLKQMQSSLPTAPASPPVSPKVACRLPTPLAHHRDISFWRSQPTFMLHASCVSLTGE
jgi:hypothetical protein